MTTTRRHRVKPQPLYAMARPGGVWMYFRQRHMIGFHIGTGIYRCTEVYNGRLGSLGFALAKGLIRGLISRYPDPSQATRINQYDRNTKHKPSETWFFGSIPPLVLLPSATRGGIDV